MTYAADNIYNDFDYTDEFVVLFDLLVSYLFNFKQIIAFQYISLTYTT